MTYKTLTMTEEIYKTALLIEEVITHKFSVFVPYRRYLLSLITVTCYKQQQAEHSRHPIFSVGGFSLMIKSSCLINKFEKDFTFDAFYHRVYHSISTRDAQYELL